MVLRVNFPQTNWSHTCELQLEFCSFNVDDEDYMGHDYSLIGQLSEVRIVYLNRFIQEVVKL